jgi:hypothetical protein
MILFHDVEGVNSRHKTTINKDTVLLYTHTQRSVDCTHDGDIITEIRDTQYLKWTPRFKFIELKVF